MRIRAQRDFWSGILFIAIAALFMVVAANYRLGTAQRMGPAYFPLVVSGMLALLGLTIAIRALFRSGPAMDPAALRALIVTILAVVLFGVALTYLGLVAAIVVLVLLGSLADRMVRPLETILLALFLAGFSVIVFVTVLGLPLQVWPDIEALSGMFKLTKLDPM